MGAPHHAPEVAIRTGDTPGRERAAFLRSPSDIFITTPESLYLMLTSRARETLVNVDTVIVDEIHALAATKRGAHLAVSLERLERVTTRPPQRIGLSATQRPLEEIARYLGGYGGAGRPRPVEIVDAGTAKALDLEVVVPPEDLGAMGTLVGDDATSGPAAAGPARRSIWPSMHPRLVDLVRHHRSTIIFVNARRLAERLASRLNELWWAEQAAAGLGGAVAGAHPDLGDEAGPVEPFGGQRDAPQRAAEVLVDVDGERPQRRDVHDAGARRAFGGWAGHQTVEAPQEGRERLARTGGGEDERVVAPGDGRPAEALSGGGLREGGCEPGPRGFGERRQAVHRVNSGRPRRAIVRLRG
jgi:hypothetical protein